jgi:hypothetical protein
MTDRVVDGQGRVWVTATGGAHELGDDVNAALIRDWARRELITGRTAGGRTWYLLADLRRTEKATFRRSRPRRRDAA